MTTHIKMPRFTFYSKKHRRWFVAYEYKGVFFIGKGCHMKWFAAVAADNAKTVKPYSKKYGV